MRPVRNMRSKVGIGGAANLLGETTVSLAANNTLAAVAEDLAGLSEPIWRWDRLCGSALEGRDPLRGGLDVFSPYDEKDVTRNHVCQCDNW